MKLFRILLFVTGLLLPTVTVAQNSVVVELFTSQGCSSCPPADKIAVELSKDENIIVLGWHVDYWDYLGWKDEFSRPENTARQVGYRERWNLRTLYTPQAVIQGETQVVGSHRREVNMYVDQFADEMPMLNLSAKRIGDEIEIDVSSLANRLPSSEIHLVNIVPSATTQIARGENAGRTLEYVNIVKDMTSVAKWNGSSDVHLRAKIDPDEEYVVLIQAVNFGPILGAMIAR